MKFLGFAFFGLMLLCVVMVITSQFVPVYRRKNYQQIVGVVAGVPRYVTINDARTTAWDSIVCAKTGATTETCKTYDMIDRAGDCGERKDRIRSVRAFGIIGIILAFFVAPLGLVVALSDMVPVLQLFAKYASFAAAGLAFFTMFCTGVCWILMISAKEVTQCGEKPLDGFKFHAGFGLTVTSSVIEMACGVMMLVVGITMPALPVPEAAGEKDMAEKDVEKKPEQKKSTAPDEY